VALRQAFPLLVDQPKVYDADLELPLPLQDDFYKQLVDARLEELHAREEQLLQILQKLAASATQCGCTCQVDKAHMFKDKDSILGKVNRELADEEFLAEFRQPRDERQLVRAVQSIFASDAVRLRSCHLQPTGALIRTFTETLKQTCAELGLKVIRVKDKSADPLVPGVTFILEATVQGVLVRIE